MARATEAARIGPVVRKSATTTTGLLTHSRTSTHHIEKTDRQADRHEHERREKNTSIGCWLFRRRLRPHGRCGPEHHIASRIGRDHERAVVGQAEAAHRRLVSDNLGWVGPLGALLVKRDGLVLARHRFVIEHVNHASREKRHMARTNQRWSPRKMPPARQTARSQLLCATARAARTNSCPHCRSHM
jgi:hypothetical protein